MDDIQLFNDDCFNIFPTLEDKSINLFILDLPYGQTACHWDSVIDLDEMWKHIKRIMKPNALIVFFCTAKFGNTLINANPKWFKYDLIWKKSRKVGFLSANKMPLRQHENIYVFNGNNDENEDLMKYSKKVLKHIGKTKSTIKKEIPMADHFFRYSKANFSLPTKETYEQLIELYNIDEMEEFIPFNELEGKGIYNPQKTEGKPYKTNEAELTNSYYRGGAKEYKTLGTENKGDRHPTSIIDHENIYVFDNTITDDIELSRNKDLREYAGKVFKFIGKTKKQIIKKIGQKVDHYFRFKSSQFGLCTNETYNQLIKEYNIDEMEDYLEYEILESLWVSQGNPTYNPQKTEGTPYKTTGKGEVGIYKSKRTDNINKGDRHPSSIIPEYEGDTVLVYKNPHKTIHRTQKPVELLEWLIKTYSNEGDLVMDFTMGSGTCAIACINTKRKFIGVEMDKEIYDACFDRIEKHKKNL